MSEKNYLITFPSTHYALKAEKFLKKNGLRVKLIPVPRDISSDCSIALEFISSKKEQEVRGILNIQGIKVENIFRK